MSSSTTDMSPERPAAAPSDADPSFEEKIREQERARIARDLHDELGAHLTGIRMALGLLRESLGYPAAAAGAAAVDQHGEHAGAAASPQRKQQAEHARYAEQLVDEATDAMHAIIDDLCPPIVEFGLAEAFEWQSRRFTRQTGIACRQQCAAEAAMLDEFQVITLFRIAREALGNVAKHAQASQVSLALTRHGDHLQLAISDNGRGFDAAHAAHAGHGLGNMRHRALALGGALQLHSALGQGTLLRVSLPLAVAAAGVAGVAAITH